MSVSKQTRAFAKQVQVDLLVLCDTDLFQTIHLWVNEEPSGPLCEGSKQTRSVLGYTFRMGEPHPLSSSILSGSELEAAIQWLAPAPQRQRELLMDMKLDLFIEYVFPLAFPSLHMIHPEWGEGATFNALHANHLRWIGMKQKGMTAGPETPPKYLPKE